MFLASSITVWQILIPVGLGLLLGVLLSGSKKNDYSKIVRLNPEEFRQNMRKGQLLDVRPAEAFALRRINGSRNFPKMSVFQDLSKIRTDLPVFVYDDGDSLVVRRLTRKLIRKGFVRVYVLTGGLSKYPFPLREE